MQRCVPPKTYVPWTSTSKHIRCRIYRNTHTHTHLNRAIETITITHYCCWTEDTRRRGRSHCLRQRRFAFSFEAIFRYYIQSEIPGKGIQPPCSFFLERSAWREAVRPKVRTWIYDSTVQMASQGEKLARPSSTYKIQTEVTSRQVRLFIFVKDYRH